MSHPEPDDQDDALARLVARGGNVRPLDDRQRAVMLARFRQRRADAEPAPRRSGAALGLAALGALSALGGVAVLRLSGEPADSMPARTVATAARHPAPPEPVVAPTPVVEPATPQRKLSLGGRGEIALDDGAVAEVPQQLAAGGEGPVQLKLARGRLRASVGPRRREEPLSIVTPHVAVVVIGTRFSVAVDGDRTEVSVEHGRVRVDRGDHSVFVDGGEALRSDDPRLDAPETALAVGASAPCADAPQRTRCLREAARGRGLKAENALFALALHERDERDDRPAALALLRTYVRRFPRGVLLQDAVLTAARILRDEGREADACALVARHARRFSAAQPSPEWLPSSCLDARTSRRHRR